MLNHYDQFEYLLACIQLVLFMLGMGATLSPRDFVAVALRPRSFLVGAFGQLVLAPVLAVVINRAMDLPPGIAVGLILVAAMPGGQMSKLFTYLARGNVALSIALTASGTLASLVTVPLLLELLAEDYLQSGDFEMPTALVVRDVTLYLLLPLVGGMAVGGRWPQRGSLMPWPTACCSWSCTTAARPWWRGCRWPGATAASTRRGALSPLAPLAGRGVGGEESSGWPVPDSC